MCSLKHVVVLITANTRASQRDNNLALAYFIHRLSTWYMSQLSRWFFYFILFKDSPQPFLKHSHIFFTFLHFNSVFLPTYKSSFFTVKLMMAEFYKCFCCKKKNISNKNNKRVKREWNMRIKIFEVHRIFLRSLDCSRHSRQFANLIFKIH